MKTHVKHILICTWICIFSLCFYSETTFGHSEVAQTVNVFVTKENSSEKSYMDQYVVKPVEYKFENGETYIYMTLKSASYWKSFEMYEGNRQIEILNVHEDSNQDIKQVKFKVTPGVDKLTSKVHIVVPAINYDNHYTTQFNFETPIKPAPTEEPNKPDAGRDDVTKKLEESEKTKNNPIKKKNQDQNQNTDDNQVVDHQDIKHKPTERTRPSQNIPQQRGQQTATIGYHVYKKGTNEISYMDRYMIKPATVIHENGESYVQLTLKNSSYWKAFDIYNGNQKVNVETVSNDPQKDIRVIKFKVEQGTKELIAKVHIVVPAIQYDNHYTTQLVFDAPISNDLTGDNQSVVVLNNNEEQSNETNNSEKNQQSTGKNSNSSEHNNQQENNSNQSQATGNEQRKDNHMTESSTQSSTIAPPINNFSDQIAEANDKENPSFNRNEDAHTKDFKHINPLTSSGEDVMTYALLFSGAVLLLSISLIINNKRKAK